MHNVARTVFDVSIGGFVSALRWSVLIRSIPALAGVSLVAGKSWRPFSGAVFFDGQGGQQQSENHYSDGSSHEDFHSPRSLPVLYTTYGIKSKYQKQKSKYQTRYSVYCIYNKAPIHI
jgi:hypothetical protein